LQIWLDNSIITNNKYICTLKGGELLSYSESKDKMIKLYECGDENASLQFSLFSYDNGPIKLQMTRSFKKRDNTQGYGKAGRLTLSEMKYLKDHLDDMIMIAKEGVNNE